MSVCDETCRPCVYHGFAGGLITCDHLLITGSRRGCPAGKGCARFHKGNRVRSIDAMVYLMPPKSAREIIAPTEEVLAARKERKKAWRREWYARNREKLNAQRREQRARETPEERQQRLDRAKEKSKAWYAEHKEEKLAYTKAWRERQRPS